MTSKRLSIRDVMHRAAPEERPEVGDAETSANFDTDEILPLLMTFRAFWVPHGVLEFVASEIEGMELDTTRTYEFVGTTREAMQLVDLEVYRNDIDACDIKFRGTQIFIDFINNQLTDENDDAQT